MAGHSWVDAVAGAIVGVLLVAAASVGVYAFGSGKLDQHEVSVKTRAAPDPS
jgi:hypothetical protein